MSCDGSDAASHKAEHCRAGFRCVHQIPPDAGLMEPLRAEEQDVRLRILRDVAAEGGCKVIPARVADDDEFLFDR